MKLLTKQLERLLAQHPLYSGEKDRNPPILVKFFTPWTNWTWYVLEGDQQANGDWLFFGLVEGFETELGYFTLSELQSMSGPGGLTIERDRYFGAKRLNDVRTR